MKFPTISPKLPSFGFGAAGLKQDAVYRLLSLQDNALLTIRRAQQANCLTPPEASAAIAEINRSRLEIQDRFLKVKKSRLIQSEVVLAEQQFRTLVEAMTAPLREKEKSLPIDERLRRLIEGFELRFQQACSEGLIDQAAAEELRMQNKMYSQALRQSIYEPALRTSIRTNLIHEMIDQYYFNVSRIFDEAAQRKGVFSRD